MYFRFNKVYLQQLRMTVMKSILKEITPLAADSLYIANHWYQNQMDFPLHFHTDFELNLTINATGKRIVGNLVEDFIQEDLVIIFPDVIHCYKKDEMMKDSTCNVVVVQFCKEIPLWKIFNTIQLKSIHKMLSMPVRGLKFPKEAIDIVQDKLFRLCSLSGFEGAALFLEILNDLASVEQSKIKIIGTEESDAKFTHSRRINKIIKYVENNFSKHISLVEIGQLVGMSPSAVCRFFKKMTRHNFWDYLNGFRIDYAVQMLTKTEHNISEISYESGFNNLSNFNKTFKERLGCTPSEYRKRIRDLSL